MNSLKNLFKNRGVDKGIYISTFVLALFGIIMIGSSSIGAVGTANKSVSWAIKNMGTQVIFVTVGSVLMFFLAKGFKTKMIDFQFSLRIYIICLIGMLGCLLWSVNGSSAWIFLGPISIQPMEFMKISMILIMAYMLTETDAAFTVRGKFKSEEAKAIFYKDKLIKCLILPMVLVFIAAFVGLFLQKDFGTTVILVVLCFICFMATPRMYYKKYKKLVWFFIIVCAILMLVLGTTVLKGYQLNRIYTWLNPLGDPYKQGYQLVNSLIAFSNGGIFGLGLGNSQQKFGYIPEAHNDFIGAIIYEELGIFGLALIIIPTCIIIFRLLKYSNLVESNKEKIILLGIASLFFLHVLINLGGISGLIPMTGVPLLFVSSGGSSTIVGFIAIGIAQSIIKKYNRDKYDTQ